MHEVRCLVVSLGGHFTETIMFETDQAGNIFWCKIHLIFVGYANIFQKPWGIVVGSSKIDERFCDFLKEVSISFTSLKMT